MSRQLAESNRKCWLSKSIQKMFARVLGKKADRQIGQTF